MNAINCSDDLYILRHAVIDHEPEAAIEHKGEMLVHMLMQRIPFLLAMASERHFGIYDLIAARQHFTGSIAVYSDSLNLLVIKKYEYVLI
ncbi:hypothetical protein [Paenibacillus odorifer]|uniref:hypothetical protein n=1 Tax=Paenibacillus odorifer TaxID=189426 RepID=UPI001481FBD6|nr:hypothetical protein [Paenibacillus odorifer]